MRACLLSAPGAHLLLRHAGTSDIKALPVSSLNREECNRCCAACQHALMLIPYVNRGQIAYQHVTSPTAAIWANIRPKSVVLNGCYAPKLIKARSMHFSIGVSQHSTFASPFSACAEPESYAYNGRAMYCVPNCIEAK